MGIWEIVASLFGGGLTGLLGSVITSIFSYKTKKLDLEAAAQKFGYDIQLKKVDAEIMAQEWAARSQVAGIEAASKEAVADADAFGKSYGTEPERYSSDVKPTIMQGWLLIGMDAFRAIVRPGLTVYLCVLTTLLYADAHKLLRASDFSQTQAEVLVTRIVSTILYLTTTCVLWWFGTRNKQTSPKV